MAIASPSDWWPLVAAVADGPLGMKPYPLGDVLGGIAVAVTDAQYISDQYTEFLRQVYIGNNDLDALAIPNTQFERVRVRLKFAIAGVVNLPAGQRKTATNEHSPAPDGGEHEESESETAAPVDQAAKFPADPILPDVLVYVRAIDLKQLPSKAISTMDFDLAVNDVQVLDDQDNQTSQGL